MANLDLHELRSKLNFTHESQGVSKSVAMKLMQELEEARAKGRKEWGRANKAEQAVARVREVANEEIEDEWDAARRYDEIRRALDGER